jgi:hypothetical protein
MFPLYDSVLGCFCLASRKRPDSYPTQSKTVLVDLGDLGLRGWQSLGGFLVFRVVCIGDLHEVLLITHCWLPELFHHHHLTPLMLLLLKAPSSAMSRNFLQLFWCATGGFAAFSALDLVLWCLNRARTWGG